MIGVLRKAVGEAGVVAEIEPQRHHPRREQPIFDRTDEERGPAGSVSRHTEEETDEVEPEKERRRTAERFR